MATARTTFSPKQVAQAIGVSEASLKRWCDKSLFPTERTAGGHRRIPVHGVVEFLRKTGHPLSRPELLGLPSTTGRGDSTIARSTARLQDALETGDEDSVRGTLVSLFLAGHSVADICDRVIACAFVNIGARWHHGDVEVYQERRACGLCMAGLYELRSMLPPVPLAPPTAIGGTLEDDPYTLPTAMAEVALREAGWRATSLGAGHPARTLCAAIEQQRPRLMWISVSSFASESRLRSDLESIHGAAEQHRVALVVGGRALTPDVRRDLRFSAYCDDMNRLVSFARTLLPAPPFKPGESVER